MSAGCSGPLGQDGQEPLNRSVTNLVVLLQALPVLFEFRVAVVPDLPYPTVPARWYGAGADADS